MTNSHFFFGEFLPRTEFKLWKKEGLRDNPIALQPTHLNRCIFLWFLLPTALAREHSSAASDNEALSRYLKTPSLGSGTRGLRSRPNFFLVMHNYLSLGFPHWRARLIYCSAVFLAECRNSNPPGRPRLSGVYSLANHSSCKSPWPRCIILLRLRTKASLPNETDTIPESIISKPPSTKAVHHKIREKKKGGLQFGEVIPLKKDIFQSSHCTENDLASREAGIHFSEWPLLWPHTFQEWSRRLPFKDTFHTDHYVAGNVIGSSKES